MRNDQLMGKLGDTGLIMVAVVLRGRVLLVV